jgi:hypothetical protein
MNKEFVIKEKNIIQVYKLEGNIREYKNCINYLKFTKIKKDKKSIRKIAKELNIKYGTALHWERKDRTPAGIKTLNCLKEKKLIPFKPGITAARLVGFLHGDGYLFNILTKFGFASSDLNILKKIKKDVDSLFCLEGNIVKFREEGEEVNIKGKIFKARKPTYHLEYGPKAICHLIFLLEVPKGKKIYQPYNIPKWIKKGN